MLACVNQSFRLLTIQLVRHFSYMETIIIEVIRTKFILLNIYQPGSLSHSVQIQ